MAQPQRRDVTTRGAPGGARKIRLLAAVGFVALACFAIATLPSSLIAGALQRHGLSASQYSGTIWSGAAADVSWRGAVFGELRWQLHPLALLRARVAADVALARADGSASAAVVAAPGGAVDLSDVRLDLPLEFFAQLPTGVPKDWRGRASGTFSEIRLLEGWPTAVRGTLSVAGLVMPRLSGSTIGSFQLVAPDPRVASAGASKVAARVSDTGGQLSVDAVLSLASGRSFEMVGTVAPRAGAPPGLVRSLEYLGPADSAGRRQFGVSGTL